MRCETISDVTKPRRSRSVVGYARVSSIPQHTRLQRDALAEVDCVRVFEDKISSRAKDRPGLLAALDYLRAGDTLCVWKLDRLGRSVKEVLTLADDLHERGIGLRILTGRLAGTYTPTGEGKFFFTMMARLRRAGTRHADPPDILLTNYKMLDMLLLRHDDQQVWEASARSLQYLVLDEFHTYDGAQGTDVAMLLRRLGLALKSYWTGETSTAEDRARPLGRITPVATSAT